MKALPAALGLLVALAGCESAKLSPDASVGPNPTLPPPVTSLIPTVKVAKAVGWPSGMQPVAPAGLRVTAFASGLDHPRWIHVLPNGDVLVAETNRPPAPKTGPSDEKDAGIKGKFKKLFMGKAGAGTPSANRITLLRDKDGDGVAETRSVFLSGLNSPFGMALIGNDFYVANADGVVRFPYRDGETAISASPASVTGLPADRNHHWTKSLIASKDGSKLYATVGSNSNVAEHGMAEEEGRAAIWEIDAKSGAKRLFATGLRNPNGMAWMDGTLWTVANERDEIGSDLVPDYLTSVKDGGFYGWPYSYYGANVDERVSPQRPDLVARAIKPDYALGNHVAALGLVSADGSKLGGPFAGPGVFIGEHGSWNRKPLNGYKVVYVPFANGRPNGVPLDVLTGFLSPEDEARGRPVGVAIDKAGGLLVADDVGNVIWRVSR